MDTPAVQLACYRENRGDSAIALWISSNMYQYLNEFPQLPVNQQTPVVLTSVVSIR